MKKLILFTTVFILFLVFLVPGMLSFVLDMTPHKEQPGYGSYGSISIYKNRDFKQEFISREKNLTAIGTTIKNPNLKNTKQIYFDLFDENNNLLRSLTIWGTNIEDGDFVKFVFDPILDSENKKYTFTISCPDAGQEEVIGIFIIDPTEEILNYTYGENREEEGGAPIVAFHKPQTRFETVKKVYSNWFSKLLH